MTSLQLPNSTNTESDDIERIKVVSGTQDNKKNDDEQNESSEIRGEVPVRNSMFWLYRRFPHIV